MARRETITAEEILNTAFAMAREEGAGNVTARRVAAKAGCSTQPIFRSYENMDELLDAVYEKAADFFRDYYSLYPRTGKAPFADLGMAYISFAKKEKHLFRLLFLSADSHRKSMYEILNGPQGNIVYEINVAAGLGCVKPEEMFGRLWIMIHGAACMALTGDYDLADAETCALLEQAYRAFLSENDSRT